MYFDFIIRLIAHLCEELPPLMNEIQIKTKVKLACLFSPLLYL